MVTKREWQRPASSGDGEIFSRLWVAEEPRAVLQIAHGMAEHSARYDEFASFLAEQGFAVCMNDHAGHGPTARVQGHFADRDGWEHVVRDMKNLMDAVAGEYPKLPMFLMGHSMGSFLSRSYIIRYGESLTGCILAGTMGPNPAVAWGRRVAALQKAVLGPTSRGRLLNKLAFGGYNRRIANPVNENAWLSTVDDVAREYTRDKDCGFAFTAAGYYDLFTGLLEVNGSDWAQRVPKALPVFLIAGDEDPVGDYGKGPYKVFESLQAAGLSDVQLKLYPGMRHELLNEADKYLVYQDILTWLNAHDPA